MSKTPPLAVFAKLGAATFTDTSNSITAFTGGRNYGVRTYSFTAIAGLVFIDSSTNSEKAVEVWEET